MTWRAHKAEIQEWGHQEGQYLSMGKSKPCTTCRSSCLQYPSTCPNAIYSSPNPITSSSCSASSSRPSLTDPAFPRATRLRKSDSHPQPHPGPRPWRNVMSPGSSKGPGSPPTEAVWRVLWRRTNTQQQGLGPPLPCPLLLWEIAV